MSVHKKFSPIGPAVWSGYMQHIYECLVLLYIRYHLLFTLQFRPGKKILYRIFKNSKILLGIILQIFCSLEFY